MMRRITTTVVLLVVLGTVAFVAPAFAGSECALCRPWWHLTSGARPSYLSPEAKVVAVDEEQEITATPGEVEEKKGEYFALKVGGMEVAKFATEELATATGRPEPTKENVQKALEKGYGVGGVVVSGGPAGPAPLLVKTLNAAGVSAVEAEALVGTAQATVLTKGSFQGPELVAGAINVGNANTNECIRVPEGKGKYTTGECNEEAEPGRGVYERSPVVVSDTLPAGLRAVSIEGIAGGGTNRVALPCTLKPLACTQEGVLVPFASIEVRIGVAVEPGAKTSEGRPGEENEVSVTGGEASGDSISRPVTVSNAPTPFGVEGYELTPENVGGSPDTQAGSHPYQLTTTITLNQNAYLSAEQSGTGHPEVTPAAQTKDLSFRLPPGLVGNPSPFTKCTDAQFFAKACPPLSVVGAAVVTVDEPEGLVSREGFLTIPVPVFNMEPTVGEPARFAFLPAKVPVFLDTAVRAGGDYGITVNVTNTTQAIGFLANTLTFWGVPGDPSHDHTRGWECMGASEGNNLPCKPLGEIDPPPFLDMPTSCTGEMETSVLVDSWADPTPLAPVAWRMPAQDGCNRLPFESEIKVSPDVQEASKPSGLTVDVHVPQTAALNGEGLAPADVKNITVALPEGVDLNPSAGDGLVACTQEQVSLSSDTEATCPNASKIATATIKSPLLPPGEFVKGFVYLAAPQNFRGGLPENPFSSLVAMYLVAKDPISGVLVKLAGSVSLNEATGQITSTFANNPQLPFEDAELHFFGGERAPLATPQRCGAYTTEALFEPWSNTATERQALPSTSVFDIASGAGGGACPGVALPFSPTLASGSTNIDAGAFSELTTTLSRPSSDQPIQSVTLHYPAGLSGLLSG